MAFDCIARDASGRERGGYRCRVSSRSRVFSLVTLAAVVASGVVVVGVLATRGHIPGSAEPRSGHPPLSLADRKSTRLKSSPTDIYPFPLHGALPIGGSSPRGSWSWGCLLLGGTFRVPRSRAAAIRR